MLNDPHSKVADSSELSENRSLSVDEAQKMLSADQIKALEVLAFFFYQIGQFDSADRAVKTLLTLAPHNEFATNMQVLCADALEDYEQVLKLTTELANKSAADLKLDLKVYRSLLLLRSRALQKLNRLGELQVCVQQLQQVQNSEPS